MQRLENYNGIFKRFTTIFGIMISLLPRCWLLLRKMVKNGMWWFRRGNRVKYLYLTGIPENLYFPL